MSEDEKLKLKLFDNLLCAYHISETTIKAWGEDVQLNKTVEECAELIVALQHSKSRTLDVRAVASEIADVLVMVVCASRIIGVDLVADEMSKKLTRLKGRIESAKPQIDLEDKYNLAVQKGAELEELYRKEVEKVELLKEKLKKVQEDLSGSENSASSQRQKKETTSQKKQRRQ